MVDLEQLTDAMVSHTMKAVNAATAPLIAKIEALEAQVKSIEARPIGATSDAIQALEDRAKLYADAAVQKAVAALPELPTLPEIPELPDIPALVSEAVEQVVAAIPAPKDGEDGRSVSVDDVMPTLEAALEKAVASIPDMVSGAVDQAVKAIPAPKAGEDGKSITVDDVSPLIAKAVTDAVALIPAPKDGVGLAGGFIDREGSFVLTLTNGEVKSLGRVVGKDAPPAEPGRDGLGFDDMDFVERDGRMFAVFSRDGVTKEAMLPGMVYRGVWTVGEYQRGDSVTYAGNQWVALSDTDEKPGEGKTWQLSVRKGRDGKDFGGK